MAVTLTEFLLARIAEDEAVAHAATHEVAIAEDRYSWASVDFNATENAEHGRRWEPERVLAECEAKRRIVAELDNAEDDDTFYGWRAIAHLAAVYADHPDYRGEWKP